MAKSKRIFTKCFNISNSDMINITEKEFNDLINELKRIKFFETQFDSFRSIIRAIKKASHDCNLITNIVNPVTKNENGRITLLANPNESLVFNLYILMIPLSELSKEDHFGVTSIIGLQKPVNIYNEFDGKINYKISLLDSMVKFYVPDIDFLK